MYNVQIVPWSKSKIPTPYTYILLYLGTYASPPPLGDSGEKSSEFDDGVSLSDLFHFDTDPVPMIMDPDPNPNPVADPDPR